MKGHLKNYKTKSLSVGLVGSCGGDGARFEKKCGKIYRAKQGEINGVKNRGVFARSWYFGGM